MSIYSDYKHGYIDDFEFRQESNKINREDRGEFFREPDFDDLESLDEVEDDKREEN